MARVQPVGWQVSEHLCGWILGNVLGNGVLTRCDASSEGNAEISKLSRTIAKPLGHDGKETGVCLTRNGENCQHGIELVEPLLIPAGSAVDVKYAYEQTKRFADMTTLITTHPAKNLTVNLTLFDPVVSKLQFEADSAHRLHPKEEAFGDGWTIPGALLPGQGIELYWYKKEDLTDLSAQQLPVAPNDK